MNERPMRFHWFWSHIAMFLGILSGLSTIGQAYYARASLPPELQWTFMADISVGIIYSFVCLCAFINRNKRTTTAWFLMLSPPLINIGYLFISILAYYNWKIDTTSLWAQALGYFICWVLLLIYYSKRKAMFDGRLDYTFTERPKSKKRNSTLPKHLPVIALSVLCVALIATTGGFAYKYFTYKAQAEDEIENLRRSKIDADNRAGQLQLENTRLELDNSKLQLDNADLNEAIDTLNENVEILKPYCAVLIGGVDYYYHSLDCELFLENVDNSVFVSSGLCDYIGLKPHSCWKYDYPVNVG